MTEAKLAIVGVGTYFPDQHDSVSDLIDRAGGDSLDYKGWPTVRIAGDDDHPSTMASDALRRALEPYKLQASDIRLLVFAGVSRDYPAPFSVATEVIRRLKLSSSCLGLDVSVGCLGLLAGLQLCAGWLPLRNGGLAAVVCAERWSQTIDRSDRGSRALWGHSDGAGAVLVGLAEEFSPTLGIYRGAAFETRADLNRRIQIDFGGTRNPTPPAGYTPFRRLSSQSSSEVRTAYENGYLSVLAQLQETCAAAPDRLLCNQAGPFLLKTLARLSSVDPERIVATGKSYGHCGSADLAIGLEQLVAGQNLHGNIFLVASTPFAFGAGLLTAAPTR